jgi:DGQHR domain-containing protein
VEATAQKMIHPEMELADPDRQEVKFPAIRATQPIGDLYVAVIPAHELGKIANFDVRRVLQVERDVERYLGIQRPLNSQRVSTLEKYVNYGDATFPTSIIIAIDDEYAEFDEANSKLIVRNYRAGENRPSTAIRKIARVLDGQHRIAGLYEFKGPSFEVPVTVFIGSDLSNQAYVFATVNLEQTKVSKSLAYDLFALAKSRSPQRTCHNIAVVLDSDEESPFYKRIKRLGVATPGRVGETITQATFVESLLPYISRHPKEDRDLLLKGGKLERPSSSESQQLIFRNFFLDERDMDIAQIIYNYFSAVSMRWSEGWRKFERGIILNRASGFRVFMKVLRPLYLKLVKGNEIISTERFLRELEKIEVDYNHFNNENYLPGSTGESDLRNDLLNWLVLDSTPRLPGL